ncbi:MAG TPA: hypothetical protein PKL48_09370 [Thermodesulfobacteriota bacterium]|nr:hypothetical protein [Thermodesulfobacteriota bacterium]
MELTTDLIKDLKPGVTGITYGWQDGQNATVLTNREPDDPVVFR